MKSVAAFIAIHLALVLMACVESVVPSGDDGACTRIKAHFNVDECGVVYEFKRPANTPSGWTEFCVPSRDGLLALAESKYGPAEPSPRFNDRTLGLVDPPCAYQCPSATGCNSYVDETVTPHLGGCFCLESP